MRLDRSLCNDDFLVIWDSVSCSTLTRSCSDHYPLLLLLKQGGHVYPAPFKFMNMWCEHADCRRVVEEVWLKPSHGCPMFVLSHKLKILKHVFRVWNKTVFGNVHNNVSAARNALDSIQSDISLNGLTDSLADMELHAQINF